MTIAWNPLRQVAAYPLGRQETLARRIGALLHSDGETILVPGEAVVALEGVARGVGRPGVRALNIVTSPYGHLFGQWLQETGATVLTVESDPGLPMTVDAARTAIEAGGPLDVVVLVHGEAASGIVNPLRRIAALAEDAGALVVVDAVASVGAHPLDVVRN